MAAQKAVKKLPQFADAASAKILSAELLISSPPLIIQLLPLQTFKAMQFLGPALVN